MRSEDEIKLSIAQLNPGNRALHGLLEKINNFEDSSFFPYLTDLYERWKQKAPNDEYGLTSILSSIATVSGPEKGNFFDKASRNLKNLTNGELLVIARQIQNPVLTDKELEKRIKEEFKSSLQKLKKGSFLSVINQDLCGMIELLEKPAALKIIPLLKEIILLESDDFGSYIRWVAVNKFFRTDAKEARSFALKTLINPNIHFESRNLLLDFLKRTENDKNSHEIGTAFQLLTDKEKAYYLQCQQDPEFFYSGKKLVAVFDEEVFGIYLEILSLISEMNIEFKKVHGIRLWETDEINVANLLIAVKTQSDFVDFLNKLRTLINSITDEIKKTSDKKARWPRDLPFSVRKILEFIGFIETPNQVSTITKLYMYTSLWFHLDNPVNKLKIKLLSKELGFDQLIDNHFYPKLQVELLKIYRNSLSGIKEIAIAVG